MLEIKFTDQGGPPNPTQLSNRLSTHLNNKKIAPLNVARLRHKMLTTLVLLKSHVVNVFGGRNSLVKINKSLS